MTVFKTHGMTGTRVHRIWKAMNSRCNNPNFPAYKNYGGRGIAVCDRWKGNRGFINFVADMGEPQEKDTIERIDVNGNYEPSNCRWANRKEQNRNRRNNVTLKYNGETKSLAEWAEITGFPYGTLYRRINEGWSAKDILETSTAERISRRDPYNHSRYIEYQGEKKRIQEWADLLKIYRKTISDRIKRGQPPLKEISSEKLPVFYKGERIEY